MTHASPTDRNITNAVLSAICDTIVTLGSEQGEGIGQIKARLRSLGMMIGELDCLIAAQALSLKLPLVTNNPSEFERIPKLTLENWAEPS